MESYLFAALAAATCLTQLLSVFIVFKKVESTDNIRYRFFQGQFLITWGSFFYFYFTQEKPGIQVITVSSVMIMACMGLFFYCSSLIRQNKLSIVFSEDSPQFHISKGPYSYIRHPFYSSYIFTYVALAIANQNWIFSALCGSMFFTYYFAARFEEKKFLSSNLKDAYANYIRTTGMFFPLPFLNRSLPPTPDHHDHNSFSSNGA